MRENTAEEIWGCVCIDPKLSIEQSFCKDIQENRKRTCPQQQAQTGYRADIQATYLQRPRGHGQGAKNQTEQVDRF